MGLDSHRIWGSSHSNSPGNSQNTSPANTPNPHGQRSPVQFNSPPYTPPQMQRHFSSPDNLQKNVMMSNMWQMQALEKLNNHTNPVSRPPSGGGSRQHDSSPYRHQNNNGGRSRYNDYSGSGRHQQHGHNRHHDNRGVKRHEDERGNNRNYQDSRWRRY